jgi:hypothetical protein
MLIVIPVEEIAIGSGVISIDSALLPGQGEKLASSRGLRHRGTAAGNGSRD